MRPVIMTIFGLSKSFGIVIAYALQNIFIATNFTDNSYIILLTFNGYLAIIQAILFFFFVPQSPLDLIEKNNH
jgi:hypothetical protein